MAPIIALASGCGSGSSEDHTTASSARTSASLLPTRPDVPTTAWNAPTLERPSTSAALPPPGFPSMEYAPSKIPVPPGQPQPIGTKFGLSYTAPPGWDGAPDAVTGWSANGQRFGLGSVSDVGRRYCPDSEASSQASFGVTGRNGVDIESAAKDVLGQAERVASDGGRKPVVSLQGPTAFEISGRQAVRFTAMFTDIASAKGCQPTAIHFNLIATPGYSNAEVAVFVAQRNINPPNQVPEATINSIIGSLRKS
ncbi:hypothetical protein [Nocardia sp. BMG51109]|uniref:hypothetical protein n=1 Tax=Nocardia sp. BMG51109 TaxID=1056816 RepID=UPI0012EB7B0E|nr:hypothetical protein [Nocardia sp. BMG51109]